LLLTTAATKAGAGNRCGRRNNEQEEIIKI
jgi:hypothetical protein